MVTTQPALSYADRAKKAAASSSSTATTTSTSSPLQTLTPPSSVLLTRPSTPPSPTPKKQNGVRQKPPTFPPLTDEDSWPQVSGSSASHHQSKSTEDSTPKKSEKTKWVAIPPTELQAAADAMLVRGSTSGQSSPRHSSRARRLPDEHGRRSNGSFIPNNYQYLPPPPQHHSSGRPGFILPSPAHIHQPHYYPSLYYPPSTLYTPQAFALPPHPRPARRKRPLEPSAQAPPVLGYRDIHNHHDPATLRFGSLRLDDQHDPPEHGLGLDTSAATEEVAEPLPSTLQESTVLQSRKPLGIGMGDDPIVTAAGSRALHGGKRKRKSKGGTSGGKVDNVKFDIWSDETTMRWRFGSMDEPDFPMPLATPTWDGLPQQMPMLWHPGTPYTEWVPGATLEPLNIPPPLLNTPADDPFVVNTGRGSRRGSEAYSTSTSTTSYGQYDTRNYHGRNGNGGDAGHGIRREKRGRGGRGYNSRFNNSRHPSGSHAAPSTPAGMGQSIMYAEGYQYPIEASLGQGFNARSGEFGLHPPSGSLYGPGISSYGGSPKRQSMAPPPTPMTKLPFPLDSTRYYLLGQIEYYFSVQNLCNDMYLRQHMDSKGWVPISTIASFPRIRQSTNDPMLLRDTMMLSTVVETKGDYVRLRGKREGEQGGGEGDSSGGGGWEAWVLPDARESRVEEEEAMMNHLPQHSHYMPNMPMGYPLYVDGYPPPQSSGYLMHSHPHHHGYFNHHMMHQPPQPQYHPSSHHPGPNSYPHRPFDNLSPAQSTPQSQGTEMADASSYPEEDDDDVEFVTAPPEKQFSPHANARALTPVRTSPPTE